MIVNANHAAMLISPARSIQGRVELYNGSTLLRTFNYNDNLTSFKVDKQGAKKFFGYGITQSLEMKLVDKERAITIEKGNTLKCYYGVNGSFTTGSLPGFMVNEVVRDENTNGLTVKANDIIFSLKNYTWSDLKLNNSYSLYDVAIAVATLLGLRFASVNIPDKDLYLAYPNGANFEGTETLQEAMDALAEAWQAIYFANAAGNLVFKRLTTNENAALTITKSDYFTLKAKDAVTLAAITHATELGDNTKAGPEQGITQVIRDNPFWNMRDDVGTLLINALDAVGGLAITPLNCSWRGNYLLELGDKIRIVAKDNSLIDTFYISDSINYNGSLSSTMDWEFSEEAETANPVTIGDKIKETYAKVDKVNKTVDIVASETSNNRENIGKLQITTDNITGAVTKIDGDISKLSYEVSTKMSAEDVQITIKTELDDFEVGKVTTSTGFTFNEDGLHISKENSEITTSITEDGMRVYRYGDEVLVADNLGVRAEDLHATTFLVIGNNSRFEDYKDNRTGCFYIR